MGLREIRGTEGNDALNGGNGAEEIRGDRGDDTITGNGGDDRLRGEKGNDILNAGAGNDRLKGGAGDDILTGGSGNDRFIFDLRGGNDTVKDFGNGSDRLDFSNFNLATVDDLLARADQVGGDVVFTMDGGETMTLKHVLLSSLDQGDFII